MPFKRTTAIVYARALVDAILACLSARPAAALLDVPTAKLFTNDITPDAATVVGDFTQATFDGYAADALGTMLGPITLENGDRAVHAEVDFIAGAGIIAPGQVAFGYYVTDTGGTVLYGSGRFDAPVPILNPGDYVSLDIVLPEPPLRDAQ